MSTTIAPKKPNVIKRILVRCPSTARLTATGLTIEESAFEKTKFKVAKINCPHCDSVHSWTKKDVILAR